MEHISAYSAVQPLYLYRQTRNTLPGYQEKLMDRRESRRINPIAHFTTLAVSVLMVFELAIISGVLELEAKTVATYAPWAYEPFLRLVGEHPESMPRWASVEDGENKDVSGSAVAEVAGIELSAIPLLIGTNETAVSSNAAPAAALPGGPSAEPETKEPPAATPETQPEEIEPVG
jgi:hypothetical protein